MSHEVWKELIPEFPSYSVSNLGRLKMRKDYISKASPDSSGYIRPVLKNKNGRRVKKGLHIHVATAFIPNPDQKFFVCHINQNKSDNRVENLKWCTAKEKKAASNAYISGKCIDYFYKNGKTPVIVNRTKEFHFLIYVLLPEERLAIVDVQLVDEVYNIQSIKLKMGIQLSDLLHIKESDNLVELSEAYKLLYLFTEALRDRALDEINAEVKVIDPSDRNYDVLYGHDFFLLNE